jgi:hypothetical protein
MIAGKGKGGQTVFRQVRQGLLAMCICAAVVQGCSRTRPIYNVMNHPIPAIARPLTDGDIARAITLAGASRGWNFVSVQPSQLRGTLDDGKHRAVIDVYYTQTTYSIMFNSSDNLKQSGGSIHRNYDNWIRNLERDIDAQLAIADVNRS